MSERIYRVRFRHPLDGEPLEMELPASVTFREMLKMLYGRGFIKPKPADYAFIVGGRLCTLDKSLAGYVPPEAAGVVDIEINGLLSIMS
jgi:hypothetical protein